MHPNMLRLGPLDVLSMGRADAWITVVMFHGYGADAFDLLPLSQELTNGRRVRWLFPQGVLEVPLGFHMMGRAWFPIDIDALNQAMAQGGHRDFARERPPGMNEACMAARAMLDELNIPMGRIVLGGFSQGAMIATELALTGKPQLDWLPFLAHSWMHRLGAGQLRKEVRFPMCKVTAGWIPYCHLLLPNR